MGGFTAFFSPPVSDLMTRISEPPPVWFLITEVLTGNLLANSESIFPHCISEVNKAGPFKVRTLYGLVF